MKLSDVGERKAIALISKILSEGNVAVGIGDDCAALEIGEQYLLVSTDMISQETHMSHKMTPYQIGWFVVAINLSDIAAKGGVPLGVVVSLGLPHDLSDDFLKDLMRGADECATCFDTSIIGGDTKENPGITICGTAVGIVKKDEFMPRKGAQPGDVVAVTGALGRAGAGYYVLKHRKGNQKLMKGLFEPMPRIKEGRALAQKKIVSSCMDISDGLSASLYQLQEVNRCGFDIQLENLPIAPELQSLKEYTKIDVARYALHFGGDYELLVTIPADKSDLARKVLEKTGTSLTSIGRVTASKDIRLISASGATILENKGYEHFAPRAF